MKPTRPLSQRNWFGRRKLVWFNNLDVPGDYVNRESDRFVFEGEPMQEDPRFVNDVARDWQCNLVTSKLPNGKHAVTLDLDYPVKVLKSRTKGHHHLYLDPQKQLTWKQYKRLLRALRDAGLIEDGYYKASVKKKFTALRKPHVGYPAYF